MVPLSVPWSPSNVDISIGRSSIDAATTLAHVPVNPHGLDEQSNGDVESGLDVIARFYALDAQSLSIVGWRIRPMRSVDRFDMKIATTIISREGGR